tara:strand:- start:193 stop:375 length:183 start_codon:yes stop_codon:yes gene_type:complete
MRVGDLVWARWESDSMGVIVKVLFEDNIGQVYYHVHWFDGWTRRTQEFEEDLVTKEEKCK